jgi:hypothetical protein
MGVVQRTFGGCEYADAGVERKEDKGLEFTHLLSRIISHQTVFLGSNTRTNTSTTCHVTLLASDDMVSLSLDRSRCRFARDRRTGIIFLDSRCFLTD